jgi:hypothetical protein
MEAEFCTLFDKNYLARGLVMYRSLRRVCRGVRLRVFCMDSLTKRILDGLAAPGLIAIDLSDLESHDSDLLSIKPTRTRVEYCWTATPAVCLFCLDREPDLRSITYLDADLMFFRDPNPLFEELGSESTMIVPHRFPPAWKHWEESKGVYNVQMVTFRRTPAGLEALRWWHERCIEWCHSRASDGRLGDQKYLDDWPERFENVRVLEHLGGGLAPWNVSQYSLTRNPEGDILVDGWPLIFYHYHSLRLYAPNRVAELARRLRSHRVVREPYPLVWSTSFPITKDEMKWIWMPYIREIGNVLNRLEPRGEDGWPPGLGRLRVGDVAVQAVAGRLPRSLRRQVSVARHHLMRSSLEPAPYETR